MDVKFEKYGITLSLPWEGKRLHLAGSLAEVIGHVANGIGEWDSYKLMPMLHLAKEHDAELDKFQTGKSKIYIALNFRSNTQLEEFCEELKQL